MEMKLWAVAVAASLGSLSFDTDAATLGLDAACGFNGYDRGIAVTHGGSRRRCDLPPECIACNETVTLPAIINGTSILWALPTVVTVGDGHLAGKRPDNVCATTLQIGAGARVVGAVENSALVITRGSRLVAAGSPTSPIVFSSLDNNDTGTGEWGGVILSSWDNTNECNSTLGDECVMEGISDDVFHYGGYVDDLQTPNWDKISSGTVRYVVIAEGGHFVNVDIDGDPDPNSNTGDEINGLTLYGVSAETSIANVHIHNNDDDGIEFFGGDARVQNLWVTCAGDDSVDWEFGYRGMMDNVYILQKDGADHAFEMSNNPNNYAALPVADGSVSDVTLAFVDSTPNVDTPFHFKEGSRGTFSNVKIGSAYTGWCSNPLSVHGPVSFTNVEYACQDVEGLFGPPAVAAGFPTNTFWAGYPGTCN